ncbi:MAG TPA: zinc dependent phospholipase C family protein [Anaerolineales bacterium]|nr:zinc dependent phospholipase C family protein [Anaerolineales bacterium]
MPTPFYHICVAESLLAHPALPSSVRRLLKGQLSAFLFGNTAPDVQVVSGQERQATHFFSVPILPGSQPAWERFLGTYPSLGDPARLPASQTAFLAGYLCHLQADWLWILDIFFPVFGPTCEWGTFPERLYLHNVLRSYLDFQVLSALPGNTADSLRSVRPADWLPFVEDQHLMEWRDYLAEQLAPGAAAKTVEVFAARQGLSPEEFYSLLNSESRMEAEVFIHLPRSRLQVYRRQLLEENLQLLRAYFQPGKSKVLASRHSDFSHTDPP